MKAIKAFLMIPSLFYFPFIYSLICLSTARLDPEDRIHYDVTAQQIIKHQRAENSSSENWTLGRFPGDFSNSIGQETSLGSEYIGCAVNGTSPTAQDVNNATEYISQKGDQPCVSGNSSSPRCTLLAAKDSAKIYFCGYPGVRIACNDLADTLRTLAEECVKTVDGVLRVRGTVALFPGGAVLDNSRLSFITAVSSDEDQFSGYL